MIDKLKIDNILMRLRTIDLTGHDSMQTKCIDAALIIQELYDNVKKETCFKKSYLDNLNTIFAAQNQHTKTLKKLLLKR